MSRYDVCDTICFGTVRQAIQFQEQDPDDAKPLANDKFAEVSIFRDQDTAVRVGQRNYVPIRRSRVGLSHRDHVMANSSKSFDNLPRNILVCEKAHHSAAITVSCSK